ncbi:Carbonic anhydrase 1 [Serratia fonticola]|nr:Carbonic anhydrase 1 [Serratia fonticola]
MQHIIEGFLSFQKEIFPQRKELFRSLASSQNPKLKRFLFRVLTAAWYPSW